MALTDRLAMGICLASITGVCWLVQQVARPITELPSPVTEFRERAFDAADRPGPASLDARPPTTTLPARLARPSLVETRRAESNSRPVLFAATHAAAASPPIRPTGEPVLPPLVARGPAISPVQDKEKATGPIRMDAAALAQRPGREVSSTLFKPIAAEPPVAVAAATTAAEGSPTSSPLATSQALVGEPGPAAHATARPYQVRTGDSMIRILRRELGTDDRETLQAVIQLNPQLAARPNKIFVGETIVLPAKQAQVADAVVAASAARPAGALTQANADPDGQPSGRPPAALAAAAGGKPEAGRAGQERVVEKKAVRQAGRAGVAAASPGKGAATGADGRGKSGSSGKALASAKPLPSGASVASAAKPPRSATRWYTVQKSDSLHKIARQALDDETRWREIWKLNKITNPDRIRPGTKIKLPAGGEPTQATRDA